MVTAMSHCHHRIFKSSIKDLTKISLDRYYISRANVTCSILVNCYSDSLHYYINPLWRINGATPRPEATTREYEFKFIL